MPKPIAEDLWADVARVFFEPTKQDYERYDIPKDEKSFFGSGRLIGRNLVLTARHVLETKSGIALPDEGWEVRLLGDQVAGCWSDGPIPSRVVWRGKGQLDLALLLLDDAKQRCPRGRIRFGRYNSVMDLVGIWVAGFPWAAREQEKVAREYSAPGKLRRANTGGLYRLTIAAANAPKKGEDWRGISGGSVILRRREVVWLLGTVLQFPPTFGEGALEVAPLETALADPQFENLVKNHCSLDAVVCV